MSETPIKCAVCQALLDEEDLFCANCGAEAPRSGEAPGADAARTVTHRFECRGCGAAMSYDASAGSLRCPFCGSQDLRQQADAREIGPRRVVPFSLSREQAEAGLRSWLGRGFWRPGDLSQQAALVSMTAVYVPYWVFEAQTHTYWTADTSQTPPGARASWYPLSGEHRGSYAGVLIGASSALTPAETHAICPFDLAKGVDPASVDLDNVIVEQFRVQRKYARPLARQGLEALEQQAVQSRYVPGNARNVKVNVRITGLASEPVLVPVWIMAYRYRDVVYRYLANGQTGRATGRAPVSWKKIGAAVAIGVAAVLVVLGIVALAAAVGGR
jgi:predicted RNA-binding Zn-ribbon protein involved in translation (DUF1610 family)